MDGLRYTLTTDGSSDSALLPILTWALRQNGVGGAIQAEWADLRRCRPGTARHLASRIRLSLELYPCDLLFVQRDAEGQPRAKRLAEIREALTQISIETPPAVCVVPVRMQEAWLLLDEAAIRQAAGNRNGRQTLDLPVRSQVEHVPDPKVILHRALRDASGLGARRRERFRPEQHALRVAEFMSDFTCLRNLSAFAEFEHELDQVVRERGWAHPASLSVTPKAV